MTNRTASIAAKIQDNTAALSLLEAIRNGMECWANDEDAEDRLVALKVIRKNDDCEWELTYRGGYVCDELDFILGDDWT